MHSTDRQILLDNRERFLFDSNLAMKVRLTIGDSNWIEIQRKLKRIFIRNDCRFLDSHKSETFADKIFMIDVSVHLHIPGSIYRFQWRFLIWLNVYLFNNDSQRPVKYSDRDIYYGMQVYPLWEYSVLSDHYSPGFTAWS